MTQVRIVISDTWPGTEAFFDTYHPSMIQKFTIPQTMGANFHAEITCLQRMIPDARPSSCILNRLIPQASLNDLHLQFCFDPKSK
jgi:hypothetical protein